MTSTRVSMGIGVSSHPSIGSTRLRAGSATESAKTCQGPKGLSEPLWRLSTFSAVKMRKNSKACNPMIKGTKKMMVCRLRHCDGRAGNVMTTRLAVTIPT